MNQLQTKTQIGIITLGLGLLLSAAGCGGSSGSGASSAPSNETNLTPERSLNIAELDLQSGLPKPGGSLSDSLRPPDSN